jgi:hypothetical protein
VLGFQGKPDDNCLLLRTLLGVYAAQSIQAPLRVSGVACKDTQLDTECPSQGEQRNRVSILAVAHDLLGELGWVDNILKLLPVLADVFGGPQTELAHNSTPWDDVSPSFARLAVVGVIQGPGNAQESTVALTAALYRLKRAAARKVSIPLRCCSCRGKS